MFVQSGHHPTLNNVTLICA